MAPERLTYLLDRQEEGTLTAPENQELTSLLEQKENKEHASLHHQIRQGLVAEGRGRMVAMMKDWEQESLRKEKQQGPSAKVRRFPGWAGILVAAAAVVLFLVVIFPGQKTPDSSLFGELASPYPNLVVPLERGEVSLSDLQEVFANYEAGEYEAFLAELSTLDTTSADLDFYRANALLATESLDEAEELFSRLATSPFRYQEQATWYLAMTYFAQERGQEANDLIEQIATMPDHEMNKRARRWLEAQK